MQQLQNQRCGSKSICCFSIILISKGCMTFWIQRVHSFIERKKKRKKKKKLMKPKQSRKRKISNSFLNRLTLRNHWKLLMNLKTSEKAYVFWYAKVYIFWKFIQHSIHWEKKYINATKICLGENKRYVLFFLLQAPTEHNLIFTLPFLNELKHKVRLSKDVCGIFLFWFFFLFLSLSFSVLFKKRMDFLSSKRHNSFQN